jgi:DNA-directed RNA polymerase specialized sigma24 family protein
VQHTLARLPKQYVEVLLLQTVSGLSCREIGRVVDCSEGAVKVKLMRAREAFKRAYEVEVQER